MPDWPLPYSRTKEIARHYAEDVPWFVDEDWEHDEEARVNIAGAFRDFFGIAGELSRVDLDHPPQPVVAWMTAADLREAGHWSLAFGMAESCLHSEVWNLVELTNDATSEEPLYGEPGVAEHERGFWPAGAVPPRPSFDALLREGVMTQEWAEFLRSLAAGFHALTDEMCRVHAEVTAARSLLFRGFFLCMDLIYAGRVLDYAWHLHATEDDVRDFTFSEIIDLLEQGHLMVSMAAEWLDRDDRAGHRARDEWLRELGIRPGEGVEVRRNEDGEWAVFIGHQQVCVPSEDVAQSSGMSRREIAEQFAEELRKAADRYENDAENRDTQKGQTQVRGGSSMEQKPLWKIDSGEFAGWRQGDNLYDANGKHVGYFRNDVAYHLNGEYLGEIVDSEWLGQHAHKTPPRVGARESRGSIRSTPRARRSGRSSKMWKDPKI